MTGECDAGELAWRIEKIYTDRVRARGRAWESYSPGTRWARCWREAASLCLRHGFDPETHVRALIEAVREPSPNMLLGERAVGRTRLFLRRAPSEEEITLRSQLAHLRGRIDVGINVMSVLTNPNEGLCASLCYCFAVNAGMPSLASIFRDEAKFELRTNPERASLIYRMLPGACAEVLDNGIEQSSAPDPGDPSGAGH
jgi:hypothetical protein